MLTSKRAHKKRHVKSFLVYSIICAIILAISGGYYILVSFRIVPMTGNVPLDIAIGILTLIVSTVSLTGGIILYIVYKKNSTVIRFDYTKIEVV